VKKKILFFLTINSVLIANVIYSIQLGTFNSRESAVVGKNSLSRETKENLYVYKTDRGLWTVRYGIGENKNTVEQLRQKSKFDIIRRGRIVPTDETKLEGYLQKEQTDKKIESTLQNKKDSLQENKNKDNDSDEIEVPLKKVPQTENKNINNKINEKKDLYNDGALLTPQITSSQNKSKNTKNLSNDKRDYFQNKISELKDSYKQIDSYTFRLKVGARVYVIQFTDNPNDEMANRLLNQKPTNQTLNTVSLSNGVVDILVQLSDIEDSQKEIENGIIAVLNESRKNQNIRIKAYRIK
jgi:hypothetical protein